MRLSRFIIPSIVVIGFAVLALGEGLVKFYGTGALTTLLPMTARSRFCSLINSVIKNAEARKLFCRQALMWRNSFTPSLKNLK